MQKKVLRAKIKYSMSDLLIFVPKLKCQNFNVGIFFTSEKYYLMTPINLPSQKKRAIVEWLKLTTYDREVPGTIPVRVTNFFPYV